VAPIVVTGNAERMAISNVQSVRFGQSLNLPIFTWRQPLSASSTLQPSDQTLLYENISELTGWFVQGAPAHLTSNINPRKGLANGTHVILHSLTLPREANIAAINSEISAATPGSFISLHCTPTSVNVTIPNIKPQDWSNDQSILLGDVVILLKLNKRTQSLKRSDGKNVKYYDLGYSLAFFVTYHKIQGKTVSKLVLDLNQNSLVALNLQSLYVGILRVGSANDMRIFPAISLSSVSWSHLTSLHQTEEYLQWVDSYKDHIFTPGMQTSKLTIKNTQKIKHLNVERPKRVLKRHAIQQKQPILKDQHSKHSLQHFSNQVTQNSQTSNCSFVNITPTELIQLDQLSINLDVDFQVYLNLNNLTVVHAQPDGHCLMHAWSLTTGKSLQEVQDIIAAEFILETELYTTFGITEVDLASYINDRQHFLQSVEAVINMLCNTTNTIAVVIGQLYQFVQDPSNAAVEYSEPVANVTEFRQIKPRSGP